MVYMSASKGFQVNQINHKINFYIRKNNHINNSIIYLCIWYISGYEIIVIILTWQNMHHLHFDIF